MLAHNPNHLSRASIFIVLTVFALTFITHMPVSTKKSSGDSDFMRLRALDLQQQGLEHIQAWGIALLETRIQMWPEGWGDNLPILLYGDFDPPDKDIEFPSLGITIRHEKVEDTLISTPYCVLEAVVKVHERNLAGVIDAIHRINILVGASTLEGWGNYAIGWWSHILHGSFFEVHFKFPSGPVELTLERLVQLSPPVRQRIEAALYWIRDLRNYFERATTVTSCAFTQATGMHSSA